MLGGSITHVQNTRQLHSVQTHQTCACSCVCTCTYPHTAHHTWHTHFNPTSYLMHSCPHYISVYEYGYNYVWQGEGGGSCRLKHINCIHNCNSTNLKVQTHSHTYVCTLLIIIIVNVTKTQIHVDNYRVSDYREWHNWQCMQFGLKLNHVWISIVWEAWEKYQCL